MEEAKDGARVNMNVCVLQRQRKLRAVHLSHATLLDFQISEKVMYRLHFSSPL